MTRRIGVKLPSLFAAVWEAIILGFLTNKQVSSLVNKLLHPRHGTTQLNDTATQSLTADHSPVVN